MKLFGLIKALKAGSSLANPATWKNAQTAANAIAVLVVFVLSFFSIDMAEKDIISLSGVIVTLVGLFNAYVTNATSKKVGLPTKE